MHRTIKRNVHSLVVSAATLLGLSGCVDPKLSEQEIQALYSVPLEAPRQPLTVYYLGHSLVGRDIPAMVAQLAGHEHDYRVQLGWGTNIRAHIDPDYEIAGYAQENDHPKFQDLDEALISHNFNTFVFTEMVEIADAIKYFESVKYTTQLLNKLSDTNPDARVYLYETWHHVNDPKGWIQRLDNDLETFWLGALLDKALARSDFKKPVYLIPAGQALSAFFKEVKRRGGVAEITQPEDFFARTDSGELDTIHFNDTGSYFVALVNYATLYHKNPIGLPHQLSKADGSPAIAPSQEAARVMQEIVWQTVSSTPRTGVTP